MAMTADIAVVLGTRPEIIKLAPVVHACAKHDIPCTVIHTGQHYSAELDSVFFDQLGLPAPTYQLEVGSASHGEQTGTMLGRLETVIRAESPETVLVQGDTNSTLAGALVTSKLDAELGHVEAGLRSGDRTMPEEINRTVTDHVSEYLFAPTEASRENLLAEGVPSGRITVTGNTVVDALFRYRDVARRESAVRQELNIADEYALLTLHRAENVDEPERFRALLTGASRVGDRFDIPVIYPIHPRARARVTEFGVDVPDPIRLVEPQEYLAFLRLEDEATLVMTDSGGVQEESCVLGTPCVTLRDSTERPETVDVGANLLAGHSPDRIVACAEVMVDSDGDWENPFGEGNAAARVLGRLVPQVRTVLL